MNIMIVGSVMLTIVILPLVGMLVVILHFVISGWVLGRCRNYTLSDNNTFAKRILVKYLTWRSKTNGSIPVVLLDFKDYLYISTAKQLKDSDELLSYVYFDTEIGPLILHPDGVVSTIADNPSFIYNWLPLDVEHRTWMILQGAKGFDY